MRVTAGRAIDSLNEVLTGWDEVEAVGVHAYGDDLYDPYFSLSFDVYTTTQVRDPGLRELALGDVGAFESSLLSHKDRFLIDEIPVRIEYKRTDRFDSLVSAALAGECLLRDAGTYAFRRVVDAKVLFSRGEWYESLRAKLGELPERFWDELRARQQSTAEHVYADLSAAAMRDDPFYFTLTAGDFLTAICALLFTVNRRFEPSPRRIRGEVLALSVFPDSFPANLENFVNQAAPLSIAQRGELAELMITSVFSL